MYQNEDLLVRRIISGRVNLYVEYEEEELHLVFKKPTATQLYRAEEIFWEALEEGLDDGLMDELGLRNFLYGRGFWSDDKEDLLKKVNNDIEDFKLKMWESILNEPQLRGIRDLLNKAKKKLAELEEEKNSYNYVSAVGYANSVKSRYLLACALYKGDKPLFRKERAFWANSNNLLELAGQEYFKKRIDEADFRSLARCNLWRSLWNVRKAEGLLFGVPAIDYTDEQRNLVSWSMMYDNIYEHPDCPSDEVIADDDILDGWLIEQKNKREDEKLKKYGEGKLNSKVAGCEEIFMVSDSDKGARAIDAMNTPGARIAKQQKLAYVKKKGMVNDAEMPDSLVKIRMAQANAMRG